MAVRRIEAKGCELLTQVITKAYVYRLPEEGQKEVHAVEVRALWDTGATHCLVTPELAERLGLQSLGQMPNNTATRKDVTEVYELGLVVNEQMHFPKVYAGVSYGGDRFDFVIGMSIIQHGRFTLTGSGDERTMTFEI